MLDEPFLVLILGPAPKERESDTKQTSANRTHRGHTGFLKICYVSRIGLDSYEIGNVDAPAIASEIVAEGSKRVGIEDVARISILKHACICWGGIFSLVNRLFSFEASQLGLRQRFGTSHLCQGRHSLVLYCTALGYYKISVRFGCR